MPRSLLSLLLLLSACAMGGPPGGPPGMGGDKPKPDDRVLVEVEPAAKGSVGDFLTTTGLLESEAMADIVPEASGLVTRVLVEEGDVVRAGQVLAELANPSLEAGADRASVEIEVARQELSRAEALHQRGAISDVELETARQRVRTAETSWSEARQTAGFTRLKSPIAGTVSAREVRIGELAGGKRAFQVVDLDRLRVVVSLPERDVARVHAGQRVELQGAYDETARATGSVLRVSPVVDATTGTARVTITVDPGQRALRPGQFVSVRIELDRKSDVLTVKREAVVWEDGEPLAWIVADAPPEEKKEEGPKEEPGFFASLFGGGDDEKDGEAKDGEEPAEEAKAEGPKDGEPKDGEAKADEKEEEGPPIPRRVANKARLEIGYQDADRVEILSGLDEGAPVVVVGNTNLREGAAVRLPEDPKPVVEKKDKGEDEKKGG